MFLELVFDFFKKTSSLGNRGARKYLLIGVIYMASIPSFLPLTTNPSANPVVYTFQIYPESLAPPPFQQPCCKLIIFLPEKKNFLPGLFCNKLPLDPCFSPCLTTAVNTISASLPLLCNMPFLGLRLTVILQRVESPNTPSPRFPLMLISCTTTVHLSKLRNVHWYINYITDFLWISLVCTLMSLFWFRRDLKHKDLWPREPRAKPTSNGGLTHVHVVPRAVPKAIINHSVICPGGASWVCTSSLSWVK